MTYNEEAQEHKTNKRTGKEIKIKGAEVGNDILRYKIGAPFEKKEPETIYIEISFWVDIKKRIDYEDKYSFINHDYEMSKKLSREIRKIYKKDLKDILGNNKVFPYYLENIYVYDFPENINYNNKRSFVSIELNLHTLNCNKNTERKYPLNEKRDTMIYDEVIKVCKTIAKCDLLQGKLDFTIHRKKKD